ncbi:MAG TPA: hypothetical protein DCS93_37275 [Microscillaceae bacterium]|nr:hypothetical protein [Microscillaceae bacterium]
MKESIFENEFAASFVDVEKRLYGYKWKRTNRTMTPEQYKAEITRQADNILQYKPLFVMVDFSETDFIIDPDLQGFVTQTLFQSMIDVDTKKLAVIQTEDYILQLSVEQTVNEQTKAQYVTQYFLSQEEAIQWFEDEIEGN